MMTVAASSKVTMVAQSSAIRIKKYEIKLLERKK